jgi:hypothetical protein
MTLTIDNIADLHTSFIALNDVATILAVEPSELRKTVKSGNLDAWRFGERYFIEPKELARFVKFHNHGGDV